MSNGVGMVGHLRNGKLSFYRKNLLVKSIVMWKHNCEKGNKYYDEVIRLYNQEGLGCTRISQFIPVGETTISRWIRIFADEKQSQVVMKRKSSINP